MNLDPITPHLSLEERMHRYLAELEGRLAVLERERPSVAFYPGEPDYDALVGARHIDTNTWLAWVYDGSSEWVRAGAIHSTNVAGAQVTLPNTMEWTSLSGGPSITLSVPTERTVVLYQVESVALPWRYKSGGETFIGPSSVGMQIESEGSFVGSIVGCGHPGGGNINQSRRCVSAERARYNDGNTWPRGQFRVLIAAPFCSSYPCAVTLTARYRHREVFGEPLDSYDGANARFSQRKLHTLML